MGWSKTMSSEEQAMLERMSRVLGQKMQANPITVDLAGPATLTVKLLNGSYRKRDFIGDESFTFRSAYMGKREGVILVASPNSTTPIMMGASMAESVKFIEVPLNGAGLFKPELKTHLNHILSGELDKAEEEARMHLAAVEAANKARRDDLAYNSW